MDVQKVTGLGPRRVNARVAVFSSRLANRLRVIFLTGMPGWLIPLVFVHAVRERAFRKRYQSAVARFSEASEKLQVSTTWFLSHTAKWFWLIDSFELKDKPLQILEIGSWEGLSTNFLLSELPQSHLVAVDTWQGSDENEDVSERLLSTFKKNVNVFNSRLEMYVGKSSAFFQEKTSLDGFFDLIYIDGSHRYEDVLSDAKHGFLLLKEGGLMVFDDYFWQYYRNPKDNPAAAINQFVKEFRRELEIVDATYQVTVRKLVANTA